MYSLISKPVFVITPDKIIIQLFYYLCLPKFLKNKYRNNFNHIKNKKKFRNKMSYL